MQSITFVYPIKKISGDIPFGTKKEIQDEIDRDMVISAIPNNHIIYITYDESPCNTIFDEF